MKSRSPRLVSGRIHPSRNIPQSFRRHLDLSAAMDSPMEDAPVASTPASAAHLPDHAEAPAKAPRPKMKRTECAICARDLPNTVFPILSNKCDHTRETCRKCWNEWLKSQIESVPADQIACTQCSRILEESDIRRLARPAAHAA